MEEDIFLRVQELLYEDKTGDARELLESVEDKDAEWHYLSSRIYLAEKWTNESRKELETAIELDPKNKKYKQELAELKQYTKELKKPDKKSKKNMGDSGEYFCSGCAECCCEGICGGLCGG